MSIRCVDTITGLNSVYTMYMVEFLGTFSTSFIVALLAWPVAAALLTLPLLVIQYRTYNKIIWHRITYTYLFILYVLGLGTFTLYPFPDNPVEFCRAYDLGPQLMPFTFIADIASDGVRAALQVVMNILFFVPLGVFARIYLRISLRWALLIAFMTSLLVEAAQLTGVFGLYPCSYRLFDVDDLLFNTLGGVLGYILAGFMPQKEIDRAEKGEFNNKPGVIRRLVGFTIDMGTVHAVAIGVAISSQLVSGSAVSNTGYTLLLGITLAISQLVVPVIWKGKTLGGGLTRCSLDNTPRSAARRFVYYVLRFAIIFGIVIVGGLPGFLCLLWVILSWLVRRRLPYQFV